MSAEEEARLAMMTNRELIEELALGVSDDPGEELWIEVALRLGVDRTRTAGHGPVVGTETQVERRRRFMALWKGQPESAD
ncbi:MAG: hypothetical protein ACRDQD_07100 [Nocardioidaceae bacterium]